VCPCRLLFLRLFQSRARLHSRHEAGRILLDTRIKICIESAFSGPLESDTYSELPCTRDGPQKTAFFGQGRAHGAASVVDWSGQSAH